ncbi:ProQ/FINO family protein [Halomonas alimentaria]|uniref:ProQ/FINO family protein n=1 Tax=Halomonas alimentaria TaxID=147248 RepID=UPI0024916D3B|nr:ProQ/FINO family protein [Halomonas alimentaria]
MAEQRLHSLLDALDGRTRSLLERLTLEREARRHAEAVQGELAQRLAELERQLAEAEATRLELIEECRELDEQNSELEAHNRHLHERLAAGEPAEGGFRPGRRSQGLSALIGRRPAVPNAAPADPPAESRHEEAASPAVADPAVSSDTTEPLSSGEAPGESEPPQEPQGARQDSLAIGEAPSPQALLDEWYTRYPAAFFKGHTRPLMVGIHEVLASREPWPEKLVRRALACYVNLPRYLKAVREDAERIDLDGQPAGKVDAQSADHAHRKLDRLQGEKRASQGRKHPGRQNERHNHKGRGKPAKAGSQDRAHGKPKDGAKGSPSSQGKGASAGPVRERAEPAPATMEEKLSALLAKHNGR